MKQADQAGARAPPSATRAKHGQGRHHAPRKRLRAPHRLKTYPDPFAVAAVALFPWGADAYPGFAKALSAALLGRASPHTIRDWRRGKRKAPAWARALLREAIERRIAELEHARAILADSRSAAP